MGVDTDVTEVQVKELPANTAVVDVREDAEWHAGHVPHARHTPLGQIPQRIEELRALAEESGKPLAVICRSGGRSYQAAAYLLHMGVPAVNIAGGTQAWAHAQLPLQAEGGEDPRVI